MGRNIRRDQSNAYRSKKKLVIGKRQGRKFFGESEIRVQRPSAGRQKAFPFPILLVNVMNRYVEATKL